MDPVFWMLHAELDRWSYTWERSHAGTPPLQGADAVFRPLTRREGARYGGGRSYRLDEPTGLDGLSYRYSAVFRGRPASAAAVTTPAPASSGSLCTLALDRFGTPAQGERHLG